MSGFVQLNAAGSWTPTMTTDGTVGTPAYTIQVGTYEQIGRLVIIRFGMTLSGWTGSPTGSCSIAGLPFASANVSNDYGHAIISFYVVTGLAASNFAVTGLITANTSTIALKQSSSTTSAGISAAQAGTTCQFFGFGSYHV